MLDRKLAGVCGTICTECKYLGDTCAGCGNVEGKPFWTRQFQVEVCPLYGCCAGERRLAHCGMCGDFPCKTFKELRDPEMSPEEAEANMLARMEELWKRKELGEDAWFEEKE